MTMNGSGSASDQRRHDNKYGVGHVTRESGNRRKMGCHGGTLRDSNPHCLPGGNRVLIQMEAMGDIPAQRAGGSVAAGFSLRGGWASAAARSLAALVSRASFWRKPTSRNHSMNRPIPRNTPPIPLHVLDRAAAGLNLTWEHLDKSISWLTPAVQLQKVGGGHETLRSLDP